MKWIKSESFDKPQLVDNSISDTYVYLHRNIQEKQWKDRIVYEYEEVRIPKAEYASIIAIDNEARLSDVEEAITEIIGGEL